MKRILFGLVMIALWAIFFVFPVAAQGLQILTEEDPPYSLTGADGKPTGYGVGVVAEIQKRLKNQDPVLIYPWARAYDTIVENTGVVVFTMTRTKEREPLFQWVGPIIENGWVFVAKKSSRLKIANLGDAKKLKSIGVVRDYAWDKYLTAQGFANLDRVKDYAVNVKKLEADRIQVLVGSNLSYQHELTELGLKPEDYEVLLEFNTVQMYIAHSKGNDKKMVAAWQGAFDAMKNDGTLAKLLAKWVPLAKLPGPAKAASF